MNDMLRSPIVASTIAAVYEKDGYFFTYDVTSEAEAAELLAEDFDRARRNTDMKRDILYSGVKSELVKENRRA